MASISLTDPVAGTQVTAGLHAGNNTALRTAINGGLDNTNVTAGAAIDLTKLAATAWTVYTPSWASVAPAPALGNGTITGRYQQIGKTVHFTVKLVMGTTTTFGGVNPWSLSLPVNCQYGAIGLPIGYVRVLDSSANQIYTGIVETGGASTVFPLTTVAGPVLTYDSTHPVAWGTSDEVEIAGTYEAA